MTPSAPDPAPPIAGAVPCVEVLPSPNRSALLDGPDPGQPSPFSMRKVVSARPPNVLSATPTTNSAPTDTGSQPTDDDTAVEDKPPAINSGLRWTIMRGLVVEGGNLLGVAILARLVAPAEFGRYAIALIVLLLNAVPTWAVTYTIVQREEVDDDHLKTGQTLSIAIGLAVCAFCLVASLTFVPSVFGARTAFLVRLMIPACFINSINTPQYAILSRRLDFRRLSVLDMTIAVVSTVVSIPLAVAGLNGSAIVLGVDAASLAGFILICCWVRPPIPNFRLRVARDFARLGIPAASHAASLVCFENCDYVIVGARVGALQAGYYFRAYALGVVYQTKISQVLTTVGVPTLSRVRSEEEIQRLRKRIIHTITLILFPLLTALAIVAPKFVTWFYGPAWKASVVPVQILTIGGAAMLVAQAVTVSMLGTGRPRAVMLWGWGHFVAYAASVFFVARSGLPAVAIAAVAVHTTFLIISYVLLHRGSVRQAFKSIADDLLPAGASSVCLAAVALPVSMLVTTLGMPIVPYLLVVALAGGAGYFLSLRLWFPTQFSDLGRFIGRLLPGRAHRAFGRLILRPQAQSAA